MLRDCKRRAIQLDETQDDNILDITAECVGSPQSPHQQDSETSIYGS